MSNEKEKEIFDFNLDGLFGDFKTDIETESVKKYTEPIIKEIPDDLVNEDDKKKDLEESKEDLEKDELEEDESESKEDKPKEDKKELVDKKKSKDSDNSDNVKDNSTAEDEEENYSYKALASYLSEQGLIDFEDSDDIEDTPEILEEAVLSTVKNMVNEYKESIPEEGRDFLNYLEKGGDPSKYFKALEKPLDFENIDLKDTDVQKKVLTEFLKTQEYSSDEIKDLLQDYEDGLILEKQATLASKKLEKIYSKRKDQLLAQQNAELKEREKQLDNYIKDLKKTIEKADSLGGLSISAKEKKEFEKYLLNRDKSGSTQYEKELQEDPVKTQLELAYLKFKKFNFSKVANKVKTEESKRLKEVFKTKDKIVPGASKRIKSSDEDEADLSAFKSFL